MIKIENIDDKNFRMDGRIYPKRYFARTISANSDKIEIVMVDSPFGNLIPPTSFQNISIDGVVPDSLIDAMKKLNTDIYG